MTKTRHEACWRASWSGVVSSLGSPGTAIPGNVLPGAWKASPGMDWR